MVRRLSFINNFNLTRSGEFTPLQLNKIDASVNVAYFMRKPFIYRFISKHHRRQPWRRRKHNFEYILYTTILSMWSTEYVFFRKMIKFNYNYCIHKTSLFVYNLAVLRSTCPAMARNSENVYLATLPKTIISYFFKSAVNVYTYWRQSVGTMVVVSSYYQNQPTDEVFKKCLISPGYMYSPSTLAPLREKNYLTSIDTIAQLYTHLFEKYHLAMILELYKIWVYMVLYLSTQI